MDENNNQHNASAMNEQTNNQELDSCVTELNNFKEKYARLGSDFENYKRRMEKEKYSWMNSAQSAILTDLLAIVDDFDRALEAGKKKGKPRLLFCQDASLLKKNCTKC